MNTTNFIQSLAQGNALEAKETLNDLLSSRAFEALDAKKIEIAHSLYGDREEIEVQDTADTPVEQE